MKTWLTTVALCAAVPFALNSATLAHDAQQLQPAPTHLPDFSVIEQDHARAYVERIYPLALQLKKERGMPLAVSLGIACLESGYGSSYYAQHHNNHLGIRSYHNGKAGYRRFSSIDECFNYFGQLLGNERYAPLQDLTDADLPIYLAQLQACGFNHRSSYTKKLLTVIDFLHLEMLVPPRVA